MLNRVSVLGGGSFGTSMADLLARRGLDVVLWIRDQTSAASINGSHRNPRYLSEFELHSRIRATSDLAEACAHGDWLFVCTPSRVLRTVCESMPNDTIGKPIVLGCKGIEQDSLMTCAEVVVDVLGEAAADTTFALSGPSFAHEVMRGCPTAVVLAGHNEALAEQLANLFFCDTFRAYTSTDLVGVEMGGALKNVMAIAAGVVSGLELGDNARAAIITRGIAEMSRLAAAHGGNPLTLAGLAGVGDMLLTCTGALSRNRAVGQALGEGKSAEEAVRSVKQVAEGYYTAASAHALAVKAGVDAVIIQAVYRVLYEGLPVRAAMLEILRRPPGKEIES